MTRLKFCPLSHVPFHVAETGPRPSSLKLFLSGHIKMSIMPNMISLPYVEWCDHNLEEEGPRKSGVCVMEILLRDDSQAALHTLHSLGLCLAQLCKSVSYVYNISFTLGSEWTTWSSIEVY
ncbi:hypothetical protein SUGI_0573570 [Cryptomeria japonica]|nr:hypothetical protein SUGI_0573570 [Cryptomeria japonica]